MIQLDSNDSPLFRRVYTALALLALAGAAWLGYRGWRLGWPSGALKITLLLAAVGVGGLVSVALAPPPRVDRPGRRSTRPRG
jgi:O-antigen ligase